MDGERAAEPRQIASHGVEPYVTGLDSRRAEIRVFRVDRVRSLQPAADPRATPPPPGYDPAAQLTAALGEVAGRHRVRVLLHTTWSRRRATSRRPRRPSSGPPRECCWRRAPSQRPPCRTSP
ncbi:WYL domain-containing protein [Streptomyces murinus]|uniref:WYL domain-containing protein n=1 Tax=Streptomyces murinus TaxID=33900 RepID=UPI0036EA2B07